MIAFTGRLLHMCGRNSKLRLTPFWVMRRSCSEDSEGQRNHAILGDLQRLHKAGLKLKELVSGLLDPAAVHQDFADFRRNLRHDLRTPISAIKGFGEWLLEDAQEARNEVLARDLKKLLEAVARLLEQLLEIARQDLVACFLRVFEEPLTKALDGADRRPEVVAQIPPKIGEILMHGSRIEQP